MIFGKMMPTLRSMAVLAALALGVFLGAAPATVQADPMRTRAANGLALTPPMGWNSWNHFACDIDEGKIRAQADAMVANGMKAAGYEYVVIDDCWQTRRDAHGDIVADAARFPSGIKALADYVHGRGLKFGIYSDAGDGTCQNRPGSRGHEYQDAAQYARWGVDYLKYDWCNTENLSAQAAYETMADALRATGRPILFSMCEWGLHQPWKWGEKAGGNIWRTTGDIFDAFEGVSPDHHSLGMMTIADQMAPLADYAGPGHWNDPDMLEVGNGGMTEVEYRTHFALWAMLAAPLVAGNDLASMSPRTLAILTARDIIAIDQDPLGKQGRRLVKRPGEEVWVKPLSGGATAVLVLNRSGETRKVSAALADLGLSADTAYQARDAWTRKPLAPVKGALAADLAAHASVIWVLTPKA